MTAGGSNRVIGGFRIVKDLKAGAGSQGTVYQAVCESPRFQTVAVGDVVALKVMAVQDDDGEAYARLEKRTAELVALEHPNIVKYHGCFCEKGPFNDVHVIVLEYVEGRSLKDILAESPCGLGADEAMRIAFGLIEGLAYTSARGIVHRDIKPANVIVRPDGRPKLIDFEVAHRVEGTATVGGSNMIGTFDYMAPDFTDAEFRGDVRSDVFSLGVCLHEMLTGRTPYRRQSGTSTQANVAFLQRWLKAGTASNPLKVSSRVGKLLPGARDLLERALAPDRAMRIPDFQTFGSELGRVCYRELSHGGHKWRFLSYIGHGGFGEVFGAVDLATGGRVAVKHLLNESGLGRFQREAATLRRVSDAGFPRFIDFFVAEDGGAFLVMEYLDGMPGQSLKDAIRRNGGEGLDRAAVLAAFVQYARALAGLHAIGVVHRDIKPANLYFPAAEPGRAVVMDLGIVRDVSGTATVGSVPGTIDYMPPECVTGQTRGGPEADVWALGLCLYEALSGKTAYPRLPEGAAAFTAYFERVKRGERPDFSGVDGKPELRGLLEEMCALDPKRRLRDVRLAERRLRIASGENPADLPVPESEFVWDEKSEDADFADCIDSESFSNATQPTVWGNANVLEELARIQKSAKKRRTPFAVWLLAVLLLAAGAVGAWRYAEHQRDVAMEKAAEQAREAAERARALEEERRRAEEEAESRRLAEEEARRKAEEERLAQAEADRREAERKAEEARLAQAEADRREAERKAAAERLAKAEEDRLRALREAEAAAEAKRRADEEAESRRLAEQEAKRKAEADRLAKAEAERLAKAEEERLRARKEAEAAAEAKRRAAAERERREKDALARAVDEETESERGAKLKQLDDAFAAYTLNYHKRLDEALKPGSRTDPVSLQQEYLLKKRAYKEARKKLEKRK